MNPATHPLRKVRQEIEELASATDQLRLAELLSGERLPSLGGHEEPAELIHSAITFQDYQPALVLKLGPVLGTLLQEQANKIVGVPSQPVAFGLRNGLLLAEFLPRSQAIFEGVFAVYQALHHYAGCLGKPEDSEMLGARLRESLRCQQTDNRVLGLWLELINSRQKVDLIDGFRGVLWIPPAKGEGESESVARLELALRMFAESAARVGEPKALLQWAVRTLDDAYPRSSGYWQQYLGPMTNPWPIDLKEAFQTRWPTFEFGTKGLLPRQRRGSILGSRIDPNKILPMRYQWARAHYRRSIANSWSPEEVSMHDDFEQWKSDTIISPTERRLILWNLGFFATAESLTANNIVLAVYHHVTNPETRQFLLRQAYEKTVHSDAFILCCDCLGLDSDQIYTMYLRIPSITKKDEFVVYLTNEVFDSNFKINGVESIRSFVRDLISFYVIMGGIFFHSGFAMVLALKRQNKMVGIGELFEYIMRDEAIHLAFGFDLIKTIRTEFPEIWSSDFQAEIRILVDEAVVLEQQYTYDACSESPVGIEADEFAKYVEFIADRCLEHLDLGHRYQRENPFPWLSQSDSLGKQDSLIEASPRTGATGSG